MQRDADEIFRVKDLSMLKSPVPTHLRKPSSSPSGANGQSPSVTGSSRPSPGIPLLARPTPKPMNPPPARPRPTPLSAMMKTPATVSKTLLPLSTASTPLANRKAPSRTEELVDEPSLVATPAPERLKEETIKGETLKVDDAAETENMRADGNDLAVTSTDADEKHRELTDSIFNDIVDSTKIQDDKEDKEEPQMAETKKEKVKEENLPTPEQTEPAKRRRKNAPSGSVALPVAVDDQLRAEVTKGTMAGERAADKSADLLDAVANGNEAAAKDNKTDEAPSTSSAMPSKPASSKEYTIDKWYLQRIPNNPKFSGVPKESSDEWVVLVGIKTDTGELWHSSIVSGREAARRIMTGSGRLYNLKGIDHDAFVKADFPKTLVDRFAQGFPERWRELLLTEVGHAKAPVSPPRTTGKLLKMPASTLKTPASAKKRSRPSNTSASTPKTPKSARPARLKTPTTAETPRVIGSTRSGRKVVTPIPFWDTNVLSSTFKPSPTVRVKRRWGNQVVDIE